MYAAICFSGLNILPLLFAHTRAPALHSWERMSITVSLEAINHLLQISFFIYYWICPVGAVNRVPLGVVTQLTAWNHPMLIAIKKIAPALATGNSIVLKPSEMAPVSVLEVRLDASLLMLMRVVLKRIYWS